MSKFQHVGILGEHCLRRKQIEINSNRQYYCVDSNKYDRLHKDDGFLWE